ncbi:MAG: ComEA family DNA-binding protein [Chloroflexi bacterium]|nr:ComEA family DNA-binding protein [Chloroflexota bacterium]
MPAAGAPWRILLAIVAGVCAFGLVVLVLVQRPAAAPAVASPVQLTLSSSRRLRPTPSPTPHPVEVYVTGAVVHPGVYRLAAGARVQDAVTAAGGSTPGADLERINLAAYVTDGEQVTVPVVGEATATPEAIAHGRARHTPTPTASGPLNVNTATEEQLRTIPGIGKITAARIVAYRAEHGPFGSIDGLLQAGVRKAELERVRSLLTVQ